MPRRPGELRRPNESFTRGEFPDGSLKRDATDGAGELAHVVRALREVLDASGESISAFAARAGLDRTTVHDLIAGRSFCDVVTLAKLERAAGQRLWPRSFDPN